MTKMILLFLGFVLVFVNAFLVDFSLDTQYLIFFVGVVLLGVPHGAADLLVAEKNADSLEKPFSKQYFFLKYIGRLLLFALLLYAFPVVGNILFIFFAAYHFGETDLNQFKTNTIFGKLFVISYGLVILSVILLHHFDDVKPIYLMFESGQKNQALINWISDYRYVLLSISGITFFISTFLYFLKNPNLKNNDTGQFLIHFAIILSILFVLPMILGFTFYFVVWHSYISISNIIRYLRINNKVSFKTISNQIILYSLLAIIGVIIFGLTGFMFINKNAIAGYIFLGLAVLTAPHMEIMYNMYFALRQKNKAHI
ncbi:MAG: Brp/Blh family beta-carotene 15,15'-dioxygenase [Sediminibacterium sp.]|nr:Brp/Blh family beta-carotene 15,15'-dioxygenase [Sediminibacterium sp.]TXT33121.1 MAG: beta-carotene 15 15'-monooxygenase brp/blh family [Chitinophagaceae bacterium]